MLVLNIINLLFITERGMISGFNNDKFKMINKNVKNKKLQSLSKQNWWL